jgi:hypothetical protein
MDTSDVAAVEFSSDFSTLWALTHLYQPYGPPSGAISKCSMEKRVCKLHVNLTTSSDARFCSQFMYATSAKQDSQWSFWGYGIKRFPEAHWMHWGMDTDTGKMLSTQPQNLTFQIGPKGIGGPAGLAFGMLSAFDASAAAHLSPVCGAPCSSPNTRDACLSLDCPWCSHEGVCATYGHCGLSCAASVDCISDHCTECFNNSYCHHRFDGAKPARGRPESERHLVGTHSGPPSDDMNGKLSRVLRRWFVEHTAKSVVQEETAELARIDRTTHSRR